MKSNKAILLVRGAALAVTFSAAALMPAVGASKPEPRAAHQASVQAIPQMLAGDSSVVSGKDALVVNAELGRLFEFYFSASAEKSLESIRLKTERELERRFAPKPATEAKQLLVRYFDYKLELREIEKNTRFAGGTARAAHARLQAVRQVRARHFSAQEIEGLFGETQTANPSIIALAQHRARAAQENPWKQRIHGFLSFIRRPRFI